MAGHSQFKNIMHRKGAQDAKRAKVFTKILREITVAAAAGGPDPESNPRLRTVLLTARQANMPKDNIERAIKRASESGEGESYEALRYEGMGPGGVALIVETLTDNRNRTAPEIRMIFSKNGGRLADVNSLIFLFEHVGCICYPKEVDQDSLTLEAIDLGAIDIQTEEEGCTIICPRESFYAVKEPLEEKFGTPILAELMWKAERLVEISDADKEALDTLVNALNDHDDVQAVWSNEDHGS